MSKGEPRKTLIEILDSYKVTQRTVLISLGSDTTVVGTVTSVNNDCVEISSKDDYDVQLTTLRIVPFGAIRFIAPYKPQ